MSKLKKTLNSASNEPNNYNYLVKGYNMDIDDRNSDSEDEDLDAKREARDLLRAFMKVENESAIIKDKITNKHDWKYNKPTKTEGLYDVSKFERLHQAENRHSNIDRAGFQQDRGEDFDDDEDQKIAYELLSKYKNDKGFIKKDISSLKFLNKAKNEVANESKKIVPSGPDDFVTRMQLRQQEMKEKKNQRRHEIMQKKEEEKKLREEENRRIKANLDLHGIVIDEQPKRTIKKAKKKETLLQEQKKDPNTQKQKDIREPIDNIMSESRTDFDSRLDKLRKKREDCEQECKQYSEDVEKIKEMVKKEVEELKNLDRMKKYQIVEEK